MKLFNKKITIYEGTIKRLYADDFVIKKEEVQPVVKKEVVNDKALFRKSIFNYISLEHDTVLPTEEEAEDYMNRVIENRKSIIKSILKNECISEKEKEEFISTISKLSSCIYLSDEMLKPVTQMDKKEIKQYRK